MNTIISRSEKHDCLTRSEIRDIATGKVAKRNVKYALERTVSYHAVDNLIERHGLQKGSAKTLYQRKATPPRATVKILFDNINHLRNKNHYRKEMIFNMDESWVAHQDKQLQTLVVYPVTGQPHRKLAPDCTHITLVGCIAADGTSVPASFIVKNGLTQKKLLEKRDLTFVKSYGNSSGFMDAAALLWWVKEIFLPEVQKRREVLGNVPALLIWDAHKTRTNADVLQWLKVNAVDVLILPAGTTSIFQPLDLSIFGIFKSKYRKWSKNGGKYEAVRAAMNAFDEAFQHDPIKKAWSRSRLLTENPEEVISEFDEVHDPIVSNNRTSISNVIFEADPISDSGLITPV